MHDAIGSAKKVIVENMNIAKEQTGVLNPYGDMSLMLDVRAEDEIISVLSSSTTDFEILTEEKGFIKSDSKPEYLAIIDPIDGSANLARGIPLASIGISIVPYTSRMTSDDAEISVIDSVFTQETYVAVTGRGVTRNGVAVRPATSVNLREAIISFDTKRTWDAEFLKCSLRTIGAVHDTRRTASNLLDLCWTASGFLDGMVDLRNMLPIIHICGTHMVFEAGGFVLDQNGNRFNSSLESDKMMNFVAASNETLARQILAKFNGS